VPPNKLSKAVTITHQTRLITRPRYPMGLYSPTTPNFNRQQTQNCYFSYIPQSSDHWSVETPLHSPDPTAAHAAHADPFNPLLAVRSITPNLLTPSLQRTMGDASKLMQFQTAAAHGSPTRPKPQPRQDVLDVSDDSSSGRSSFSSEGATLVVQDKSCSRCQTTYGNFIAYSLNSYYCTRCAKRVGYGG